MKPLPGSGLNHCVTERMAEERVGMRTVLQPAGNPFATEPDRAARYPVDRTRFILGTLFLIIMCQVWLIFEKAINWDEFLHFGQIYELADGRLGSSIQTLPTRLFGWATLVSEDVVTQIQAIRFAMLACAVTTAVFVTVLVRRFVSFEIAVVCGLVYLTAGFVFTNAFTYRTDPVAAAALMGALCVFTFGQFSWMRAALVGILVGFAGALTIKSIFYMPCFAAIAWLHWFRPDAKRLKLIALFCTLLAASLLAFILLITWHGAGLPASEAQGSNLERSLVNFLRFFEFEQIRYVFAEAIFAPLVTIGLLMLPFVAKGLPKQTKILLIGLCGPLLCLLFYRNTFPYFFTFLLPPICVAIAPVLSKLIARYNLVPIVIFALIGPVFLLTQEPYGTLDRQRATIEEVERLFPEPTPYLSYSSYVPHYPRQFPSLISGVGLRRYWDERNGQLARDIEAGRIAFVIATGDALDAVYKSDGPAAILPERDVKALRENFLQHSDTIFILGRKICPQANEQTVEIVRSGVYSVDGGDLEINGRHVAENASISLPAGPLRIRYQRGSCVKLWALDHVPKLPAQFPSGPIAGGF
jgi:hypothetical protein